MALTARVDAPHAGRLLFSSGGFQEGLQVCKASLIRAVREPLKVPLALDAGALLPRIQAQVILVRPLGPVRLAQVECNPEHLAVLLLDTDHGEEAIGFAREATGLPGPAVPRK